MSNPFKTPEITLGLALTAFPTTPFNERVFGMDQTLRLLVKNKRERTLKLE
jgi:hypothetical protein